MKVLITGVTGFVGSHLAELCVEKGVELHGFRRYHLSNMRNVEHLEAEIEWHDCDMMDGKSVDRAVREAKPDVIFHMAAQSFVSPSWDHPLLYMDANYKMTVNLFEACLRNDLNPRIHIPGSGEEYGDIPEDCLPIRPETELRPVNPYAVSKIAQDMIAYVYFRSYGLNVIRTRAFNHEGPRRAMVFGIPWYAYQIARIERKMQPPVVKVGHLDDRRNFTHVKDMARAYWLAVEKCEPGRLYLVGTEAESHIFTFREALEMLIAMSSTPGITYEVDPQYVRPTQVPRLICDASDFAGRTGWTAEKGFDAILTDTIEYWRAMISSGRHRQP